MDQSIIFVVDDDEQVLRAITRDLKNKYRQDYRILSTTSAKEALDSLLELKNKGDSVAMFISDQRMPEMEGVDFLKEFHLQKILPANLLCPQYSIPIIAYHLHR